MSSYGCQQNLINPDRELKSILEFICEESNKLANCGTYYSRQLYFKTGKLPGKYELHKLFKENLHFKALYSHVAQQTLTSVSESFKSYIGLLKGVKDGTVTQHPRLPKYRKNSLKLVTFPKADVKRKNGQLRFPLGNKDAVNKAARLVLNHCLENQIGTVVFGWNKGMRQEINLGSKTNQNFVQIPTARLKDRISQLCEQYGIRFVETEESYTSKASFLDADELPKFGEKPEGWKESGKRVNRGLYRSKDGSKVNADCNGAANILRKVAITLGLCLKGVSRGALISPLKVRIWTLQESPSL